MLCKHTVHKATTEENKKYDFWEKVGHYGDESVAFNVM
jgi:hypothetical protein